MIPKLTKLHEFSITYFNKEELKILDKEIFSDEIYEIELKKNNPVIFDVGSYIGLSILYFKKKYPKSKIFAFEPNPNVYPLLEENISQNGLSGIEIHNVALGLNEERRPLYIDSSKANAFSTSSFLPNAWNGKQKTLPIKIQVKKLSTFLNIKCDLLKMDVEGAEYEILKDLVESGKIEFIQNLVIEYHPISKNRLKKMEKLLIENNFELDIKNDKNGDEGLVFVVGKKSSKQLT